MTQPFPFETERHQDETAPSAVHPTDFVSTTDPALDPDNNVFAGKRWRKQDSLATPTWFEIYVRNEANDAWLLEHAHVLGNYTTGQVPVADANGRLTPTDLGASFAPVVDISSLAADGTTDDTTALNALIAAHPDDVVFDGRGALYKITALSFPAMNRVTFRNFRFTVPGDTVPISASGLVYQCHFSDIFITAGSQSTGGRRIWDFTNFSNCVFRLIRTFGVDNISDHWYGTKNGGGSAPYYNRFEELYAGVGRYLVNCADAGSTATGPNANTWADCRFQPGARVAVRVMKYCQSLVFQNVSIEGTGTGYEMNGRGCTIRGGYMEGLATNIHLDTDSFGCVVDFPYFSTVGTKIDDDGTDNVVFGHRDDLGTVVDNVTGSTPAAHASSHENGGGDEISVSGLSGTLADSQPLTVAKAGSDVGTRAKLNLIEGSNVTLTVSDNGGSGRVDVTIAAAGSSGVADGDKGDITVSSSGAAWAIDNDVVTYAKMQNVSAQYKILARKTSSAGDVEECSLSEVLDFVISAAQGDILYRGASGWARLGAGTSGHYLKTQGAGADPVWAAVSAGAGALVFIERKTATGASWDFTTGISSTYDEYEIHFGDVIPQTDNTNVWIRLSTDGGSTFVGTGGGTDYQWVRQSSRSGSTLGQSQSTGDSKIDFSNGCGNQTGEQAAGVIRFANLSGALYKSVRYEMHYYASTPDIVWSSGAGVYKSTTAVNGIRFQFSSGNITSGWANLYGVAKA